MANSNDVKKMLAFLNTAKRIWLEYDEVIEYLIAIGDQFEIDDAQMQVVWDKLKAHYPKYKAKWLETIDKKIAIFQDIAYYWFTNELQQALKESTSDEIALKNMKEEFEQFIFYMINTKE